MSNAVPTSKLNELVDRLRLRTPSSERFQALMDEAADTIDALRSAALSAGQATPVAIKPLEWEEFKTDFKRSFQANAVVGQYQIGYLGEFEEWQLYSPGAPSWKDCFTRHASVSAAKIAARVAYEARIRSALSVPLPEIEGGDKGDGWQPADTAPQAGFFLAWSPDHPELVMTWKAEIFHQARKPGTPRHLSANHFTLWMQIPLPGGANG